MEEKEEIPKPEVIREPEQIFAPPAIMEMPKLQEGAERITPPLVKTPPKIQILAEVERLKKNGLTPNFATVQRNLVGDPKQGKLASATFRRWWGVLRDENLM